MATTARAALGQSQELGTPSGSSTWVAAVQVLGPSPATCPGTLAGNWLESRVAGTRTGAPRRDAGVAGSGLPAVPQH